MIGADAMLQVDLQRITMQLRLEIVVYHHHEDGGSFGGLSTSPLKKSEGLKRMRFIFGT